MTKGKIDRLGERIASLPIDVPVPQEELDMLQEYRKTFKDPLARTFNKLLVLAKKVDRNAIVTYRIKRINTIIRKLHRFSENQKGNMRLSRMWDIAGCRCIMNSSNIKDIYKLKEYIVNEFGDCKVNDYIETPKIDGYKSLHIYVKDKDSGVRIEVQVRNRTQHNWATLVEITDLIYNTKIKEGEHNPLLKKFLLLFSRKDSLTYEEKETVLKIGKKYNIFKKMSSIFANNYLNVRRQWLDSGRAGDFYVIEAGKKFKSEIESFKYFDAAEDSYYRRYLTNQDSNIVLTYIKNAKFEQISIAYSNYILTVHSFFEDYRHLIEEMMLDSAQNRGLLKFCRHLNHYCSSVLIHYNNTMSELNELDRCFIQRMINKGKAREWMKSMSKEIADWNNNTKTFMTKLVRSVSDKLLYKFLIRCKFKILNFQVKHI